MKNKKILVALTVAACLCTVVLAVINASFGVMLTPMTDNLLPDTDASAEQGYPNSAMQISSFISVVALLFIGGKINKSVILSVSSAAIAIVMIILGTGPSFIVFVALFLIIGLAFGATDVLSSSLIADLYGAKSTSMMCILHACHGSAGMAAPIVLTAVLSSSDKWSAPYTAVGILSAAVLLYISVAFFCGRRGLSGKPQSARSDMNTAEKAPEGCVTAPVKKSFISYLSDRNLLSVCLSLLFYGIYLVGMICWTERYESGVTGGSGGALSLTLLYVGLTVCRLVLPLLHINPLTYLRWSPLLGAAVLAAGILSQNGLVFLICAGISALIPGAFIPVAISAACTRIPDDTTLASTAANLFMLAGNSVSSPLIGALGGALGLGFAMLLPAAALLLSFACSFIRKAG